MTVPAALVTKPHVEQLAAVLDVDWIKVRPWRGLRALEPDAVEHNIFRPALGQTKETRREFFAHEVSWSINGKVFAAALPVRLRQQNYSGGFWLWAWSSTVWKEDEHASLNDLKKLIDDSRAMV